MAATRPALHISKTAKIATQEKLNKDTMPQNGFETQLNVAEAEVI